MVRRVERVPDLSVALQAARESEEPLMHYLPLLVSSFVAYIPGVAQAINEYRARAEWDAKNGKTLLLEDIDQEATEKATEYLCCLLIDVANKAREEGEGEER